MKEGRDNSITLTVGKVMSQNGFYPGDRIGVGLSGGADSVACLVALNELGYNVVALHCNFHLRGEESDSDTVYCQELCHDLGCELEILNVDADSERRPGESVEMVCRRIRYDWWNSIADRIALKCIAIAHHKEDVVETVLINLFRGTGLSGLAGISQRRDIYIRPLLDASRRDIEDYLTVKGIAWRIDSTNLADDFKRNAIRNRIMPMVREYFTTANEGILNTASNVNDVVMSLNEQAAKLADELWVNNRLNVRPIGTDADMIVRVSKIVMSPGVSYDCAKDIAKEREGKRGGKFKLVDGSEIELYDGCLYRVEVEDSDLGDLQYKCVSRIEFEGFDGGGDKAYFDADLIGDVSTLTVRGVAEGDRMRPFGMKGSRLVSDILREAGIAPSARQHCRVLLKGNEIIWLIGIRASAIATVKKTTENILIVSVE